MNLTTTTLAFLREILPTWGRYCATTIHEKIARNTFFDTVEALAEFISAADARQDGTADAVYHACAAYDRSGKRTQGAVVAVRSLWLDVDAGEGKPYPDREAAALDARRFIAATQLDPPLVVGSGRGLHLYWLLQRDVEPARWRVMAEALKRLCVEHGFKAGPERTGDLASILRPVGSHWRKGGGRVEVVAGPVPARIDPDQFPTVELRPPSHALPFAAADPSGLRNHKLPGLNAAALNTRQPERIDPDEVADRCPQLLLFRSSGGRISEPLWYAGLGCLSFIVDGDAVAYRWSSGHPDYSDDETRRRLDRTRLLSGPTTCQRFQELDPGGACERCEFKGAAVTPLDVVRLTPQADSTPAQPISPANGTIYQDFGYYKYLKSGQLVFQHESKNGEKNVDRKICNSPIALVGVQRGEVRADKRFVHFKYQRPAEADTVDIEVSVEALYGSGGIAALANQGVTIHDWGLFTQFLKDSIDRLKAVAMDELLYEQYGWKNDMTAFLAGDRLYRDGDYVRVPVAPNLKVRSQWVDSRAGATLEAWKGACSKLFQGGTEGLSFAVLASFAAPLMRFLEDEEGGAIVALCTRGSGMGKTTALAGGRTVWSWNEHGLAQSEHNTLNAKGISLGHIGNLPVFNDEFNERDPELLRKEIMRFTSGRDRERATGEAEIKFAAAGWQTILLTASNRSIYSLLASDSRSEAAAMRVLEFPVRSADKVMTAIAADRLKQTMERNGGVAGDLFLRYITRPEVMGPMHSQLEMMADTIYTKGNFEKQHRYWVRTLACIYMASLIVQKLELVDFSPDRIMAWAVKYFAYDAKMAIGVSSTSEIGFALTRYIAEHVSATVQAPRAWVRYAPMLILDRRINRILIRHEADTNRYIIAQVPLRKWLQERDISWGEFTRELIQSGVLTTTTRNMSLAAGTDFPGGQELCSIFDGEHPAFSGRLREIEKEAPSPIATTPASPNRPQVGRWNKVKLEPRS